MSKRARLVMLISGSGTNLQAILDAAASNELQADVVAVLSNRTEAFGLQRASQAGVPAVPFPKEKGLDRREYDRQLAELVESYQPDWVLLAGWMRILTMSFLERFPDRVVNIHPALPGAFPGTHAIERAWKAFQEGEIDYTGVMVHLVPDEGVDCGPLLGVRKVPILPEDTLTDIEERIHAVEHQLYVQTLQQLIRSQETG